MSVPVGKRKQAQSAYVQKMIELQKLTMERMKATPSRYRKMLNDPIWAHQSKAYMEVVKANGIRPKSPEEIKRRDDCLKKALAELYTMQRPLWDYWSVMEFDDRRMKYWAGKINEEIVLIIGVLQRGGDTVEKRLIRTISWHKAKEMEFIGNMAKLHKYCYQKIAHVPRIYYDYVSGEIIRCADEAWAYVLLADEILPQTATEADKRARYFKAAFEQINMMQVPLYALWNVESYSEREMDEWAGMLDTELKLLQGIQKADRKRFARLHGDEIGK